MPTTSGVPLVNGRIVSPDALVIARAALRTTLSATTVIEPLPVVETRSGIDSTMPVPPGPATPVSVRLPVPVVRTMLVPP